MKKILAAALSLLFILALTVPGFADGDTVVTMDVPEMAFPEDCEWTLSIPADFSVDYLDLYTKYKNYSGTGFISSSNTSDQFSLQVSGLPKDYQIKVSTTHTPLSSPNTNTVLNYSVNHIPNGTSGISFSDDYEDDLCIIAKNKNELAGVDGYINMSVNIRITDDIEAIGALKAGSYSSTITFTSQLEPMA